MIVMETSILNLDGKSAPITGTLSGLGPCCAMSSGRHSAAALLASNASNLIIESALMIGSDWTAG